MPPGSRAPRHARRDRLRSRRGEGTLRYREKSEEPSGVGELVNFRSYLDPTEAKLDAARLTSDGIENHVLGEGLHNVIVPATLDTVRIMVRESDLERARELLEVHPGDQPRDDDEEKGTVRCPRCELAYCFHERMRVEGSSSAAAFSFIVAPLMFLFEPRWHCHKCGHVWDDAREGPAEMTKLADDDPTPVFRLRRSRVGMGLFLGVMTGLFAGMIAPGLPPDLRGIVGPAFFFGAPLLGFLLGRAWTSDVCSEPRCRTPLPSGRGTCPRCNGEIGGVIRRADEHYACAADVRRELAAARSRKQPAKKLKKKRAVAD